MTTPFDPKPGNSSLASVSISASTTPSSVPARQTSLTNTSGLTQAALGCIRQADELQKQLALDMSQAFAATSISIKLTDPLLLGLNEFSDLRKELKQLRDCLVEAQTLHVELLRMTGSGLRNLFEGLDSMELSSDGSTDDCMRLGPACLATLQALGIAGPQQLTPLGLYHCVREFIATQTKSIAARYQEIQAFETLLAHMEGHIETGLFLVRRATALMNQLEEPLGLLPGGTRISLHQHLMQIVISPINTAWPIVEE